jgi:hypothetical protein
MQRKVNKSYRSQKPFVEYERRNAPPQYNPIPILARVVRYRVTTTVSQEPFTVNNLVRGCGGLVATTTTAATPFCSSVRLKKIEAWAPPSSVGSNTTVAVQWETQSANEDFAGPAQIIADTSVDPSRPAHVITKPPKDTQCEFWKSGLSSSTNTICLITAVAGSVIDFHINYCLNEALGVNASVVVVGALAGGMYHQQILTANAAVVSLNSIA